MYNHIQNINYSQIKRQVFAGRSNPIQPILTHTEQFFHPYKLHQ